MTIVTEQPMAESESFGHRRPLVLSLLLVGFAALAFSMSWFFAAVPLTGVEPGAAFIDCGPALVGRPDPLPHPSCGGAYGEVIVLSMLSSLAAAVGIAGAVVVAARAKGNRVNPLLLEQEAATN